VEALGHVREVATQVAVDAGAQVVCPEPTERRFDACPPRKPRDLGADHGAQRGTLVESEVAGRTLASDRVVPGAGLAHALRPGSVPSGLRPTKITSLREPER
jgi:hypothetical protein